MHVRVAYKVLLSFDNEIVVRVWRAANKFESIEKGENRQLALVRRLQTFTVHKQWTVVIFCNLYCPGTRFAVWNMNLHPLPRVTQIGSDFSCGAVLCWNAWHVLVISLRANSKRTVDVFFTVTTRCVRALNASIDGVLRHKPRCVMYPRGYSNRPE